MYLLHGLLHDEQLKSNESVQYILLRLSVLCRDLHCSVDLHCAAVIASRVMDCQSASQQFRLLFATRSCNCFYYRLSVQWRQSIICPMHTVTQCNVYWWLVKTKCYQPLKGNFTDHCCRCCWISFIPIQYFTDTRHWTSLCQYLC